MDFTEQESVQLHLVIKVWEMCTANNIVSFMSILRTRDVFNMALTCQQIFKALSVFISENYVFEIPRPKIFKFRMYTPKKAFCNTLNNISEQIATPVSNIIQPLLFKKITNKIKFFTPQSQSEVITDFDQSIDYLLPSSITHLTFGDKFNQTVDNLPPSLTHLIFGYYFNQPVDLLPHSLLFLKFGFFLINLLINFLFLSTLLYLDVNLTNQ